ncbi:MAG: putative 2OG-Fe(II) oxygenase [Nitrospirota bacterium]
MAKQVTTLSERCSHRASQPDEEIVEVWANVQRNSGTNTAHSHPGNFWAGVYYVDVGEVCPTQGKGGELQIDDPRGCLPRMLAPYLQYSMTE